MSDKGLADLGRIARECLRLNDEGGGPELGITFFDTANVYGDGHNEQLLGRAFVAGAKK